VFLTSLVSIRKADGTVFEKLKASVSDNKIEIHDTSLLIDVGDIAIRNCLTGVKSITGCSQLASRKESQMLSQVGWNFTAKGALQCPFSDRTIK
jgi:hypothetical protein